MILALRIDVDSLFGLSKGVPRLLSLFDEFGLKATFFIPMGPDRIGRNVKRVAAEKGFGNALGSYRRIYPWRLSLAGTLIEMPRFCEAGTAMMRRIRGAGHDVGIHSYNHHRWQTLLDRFSQLETDEDFKKSIFEYTRILKKLPRCSAAPGWRANALSLSCQEGYGFDYASDTRNIGPFYPVVNGTTLKTLQVPVTLPTFDELTFQGKDSLLLPSSGSHVYCAHAETDGLTGLGFFRQLLREALARHADVLSLSAYARSIRNAPMCSVRDGKVPGRESPVALQMSP